MTSIPTFECKHSLIAHTKPINTLSISNDGLYLLSGADDGLLIIWNLENGKEHQRIAVVFNGPVSKAVWTPLKSTKTTSSFCFGTSDGTIFVYHQHLQALLYEFSTSLVAHDGPIEDIAFDPQHCRVASVGGGCLKVWNMTPDGQLVSLLSTAPRPYIARSVAFYNQGACVLVGYLETHEVIAYDIVPFAVKWSHRLPTRIGHAILSADEHTLLVSNLTSGIDTYALPPQHCLRSYQHPIHRNVPLLIASALHGALTVVGSDDGLVRVYDQCAGSLSTTLTHGRVGSLVQTVAAHSIANQCTIATGSSENDDIEIKIWKSVTSKVQTEATKPVESKSTITLGFHIFLIVFITVLAQFLITYIPANLLIESLHLHTRLRVNTTTSFNTTASSNSSTPV